MPRLVTVLTATVAVAIGLAAAPSANAATTCDFSASILTVTMDQSYDTTLLAVSPAGTIQVRGVGPVLACSGGTPTVTTTDTVLVIDTSDDPDTPEANDGNTHVSIIGPGSFAPGKTQEQASNAFSEIEFILNLNAGRDDLFMLGGAGADDWRLGKGGINVNAGSGDPAPDADISTTPLATLQAGGADGDDTISA